MIGHHKDNAARTACRKDRKNRDVAVDDVVITPFETEMIGALAEMLGALVEVAGEPVPMKGPLHTPSKGGAICLGPDITSFRQ